MRDKGKIESGEAPSNPMGSALVGVGASSREISKPLIYGLGYFAESGVGVLWYFWPSLYLLIGMGNINLSQIET